MVVTLWFSYSLPPDVDLDSAEPLRAPYTHTWHTGRFLRDRAREQGWQFRYVNLDDSTPVAIDPDDIVMGHAWFTENAFMQQVARQQCKAKFILQPYAAVMVGDEALPLLHEQWGAADWLFLTTGQYWWDTMETTPYAKYKAKATRLDNLVNPAFHPFSKTKWNPVGKRAALCFGYDNPIKGLDAVGELARVTGIKLFHAGQVAKGFWQHVPRIHSMEGMHFTPENIQWLCDNFDVLLHMGRFDANPTTLAETACWGILPCCTKESGYWGGEPFVELKHGDIAHNMDVIDWIQRAPAIELADRANRIRETVIQTHSIEKRLTIMWDKMLEFVA